MSRVAKAPVVVPAGVDVKINGQVITIKGKNGELTRTLNDAVEVKHADNTLTFGPRDGYADGWAQAGTARALLNSMVIGVTEGFTKKLQLVGVGYRAAVKGNVINLSLGFSHPVDHQLPAGITAECPTQTEIVLKGADKQVIGQVAADLRAYRRPEPYNTYRPENDSAFYYHIYNFLQKSYCPCLDHSDTESDEAAVKRYLREYLAELGFNKEDFHENGKLYALGKYTGTIRRDNGKSKSLMKQYIMSIKNEYKKDYREKKLDKDELEKLLRNIDKFYNAFYSLSVLLDIQRKTKILQSLAYYLRVLVRKGLWTHGLYGYAEQYLYDFTSLDTTPYAKKLLEMF